MWTIHFDQRKMVESSFLSNLSQRKVLNESFNVLGEITDQLEREESSFKTAISNKNLDEIRRTISGLINWTDNQSTLVYIFGAALLIIGGLLFFAILINCGISPCQCFAKCLMCLFKGVSCCLRFYCCNKKFMFF